MDLKLINEFTESAQYRSTHAFKQTTARVVCDHAFMDMIGIWITLNEFETAPWATTYAQRTGMYNGFTTFRQASTDLYLNLHAINQSRTDLLSSDADSALLSKATIDIPSIIRYLRLAKSNTLTPVMVRTTLQRLEQSLYIEDSNYRSVRRIAQNWQSANTSQKRTVLTRMAFFYRMNARRAEMGKQIIALGKGKNLIDDDATNPEMTLLQKAAVLGAAGATGFALGRHLGMNF